MSKIIYCVANTKGGVGKSTVSWHVMPLVLGECAVVEIDDNNQTANVFKTFENIAEAKSVKLDELDSTIASISFKAATANLPIVIDAGGGNDTRAVIQSLAELDLLKSTTFVIPVKPSRAEVQNALDTYELAINGGVSSVIFVKNGETKDFIFWDGSNDYDTTAQKPKSKNITEVNLPPTPLFDIAAIKNETIGALAQLSREISTDELIQMANGDETEYKRLAALFRNAKRAAAYIESYILPIKKVLK